MLNAFRSIILLTGASLLLQLSGAAWADVATPVSTPFDSDLDGWTPVDAGQGGFVWFSSDGNPGGYFQFVDGQGGSGFIKAPAKFLGDWGQLDGVGTISYDHRIVAFGMDINAVVDFEVVLIGANGSAQARATSFYPPTLPPTPTGWNSVSFPIEQASWTVESGTWAALLADVEELRIRIEQVDNQGSEGDTDGLDNIVLEGGAMVPISDYVWVCLALLLALFGAGFVQNGIRRTES